MNINSMRELGSEDAFKTYQTAWDISDDLIAKAQPIVAESLKGSDLDPERICIATVGSTARREAMNASDIDLLPVWCGETKDLPHFEDLTGKVREDLRQQTGMDVSTSRNLMRSTQLSTLCRPDGIGGDDDYRRTLTQRMLILTESEQLGGSHPISAIRRSIMEAYVGERDTERTVSKHPMAVCNDIARYYRTLCVDYKSRAETKPESWAERHAKLRNARKLWYFSTVMAISRNVADANGESQNELFQALEETFSKPPVLRLLSAVDANNGSHASYILNLYSRYLEDMSDVDFRESLAIVDFEHRKDETLPDGEQNPYHGLYNRSRDFSGHMIDMLLKTADEPRRKVYQWFFL